MIYQYIIFELASRSIIIFTVLLIIYPIKGLIQTTVASLLGDKTAKDDGFLSLNPLTHINITILSAIIFLYAISALLLPELFPPSRLLLLPLLFGTQWLIPIPLNINNFKRQTLGCILVALSGPLAFFFVAFLFLTLLYATIFMSTVHHLPTNVTTTILNICSTTVNLSIWFGFFDFLPIPPLDGGRILQQLLPYNKQYITDWLERYATYIIIFLFFCPVIRDMFFSSINTFSIIIKSAMLSLLS